MFQLDRNSNPMRTEIVKSQCAIDFNDLVETLEASALGFELDYPAAPSSASVRRSPLRATDSSAAIPNTAAQ